MKQKCPHCAQSGIEMTPEELALASMTCQCEICRARSYFRRCPKCKKTFIFRAPAQTCPDCRI